MARSKMILVAGGAIMAVVLKQRTFVPPALRKAAPAVIPAATMMGGAPVFADTIGDAAKQLAKDSYPFLKEIDWTSGLSLTNPGSESPTDWAKAIGKAIDMGAAMDPKLLKAGVEAHHKAIGSSDAFLVTSQKDYEAVTAAIGRMVASVPESKTMDVYNSFSNLVSGDVPPYLMSTVKEADAKKAYEAFLKFKDVVKANPINPAAATSGVIGSRIDEAAAKLSAESYAFMKDVDWTSNLFLKKPGSVTAKAAVTAVDKALVMGAGMDSKALQEAAQAHVKAIANMDKTGVLTLEDFTAINAGLGKAIAAVPTTKVMDVYNSFSKITDGAVPNQLYSTVNPQDAIKAYNAFLNFKDVVKASR